MIGITPYRSPSARLEQSRLTPTDAPQTLGLAEKSTSGSQSSDARMPILVNCPKCKTKFQVSEKFAGMEGPCPKCKAKIRIPKAESPETASSGPATAAGQAPAGAKQPAATPAAKQDASAKKQPAAPLEVKIHEPETIGPKTSTGRPVVKPLARKETQFALVPSLVIAAGTLLTFIIAWLLRQPLQEQVWLRAVGLLLLSAPLAVGAYWFLQNDELEPHRGRSLWLRGGICGLVYLTLWGAYHLLPADATSAPWSWIYIAPPFFLIGAGAAFATFDLEIENAFFHYCFYVLVTLALGFTAGLPMPWNPQTKPRRPGANEVRSAECGVRNEYVFFIPHPAPRTPHSALFFIAPDDSGGTLRSSAGAFGGSTRA